MSSFTFGMGAQKFDKPANPAVGSQYTITVPGGKVWRIMAVYFTLVTGITAGNRYPAVAFLDGDGDTYAEPAGTTAQAASATTSYSAMARYGANSFAQAFALPDYFLHAGFSVQVGARGFLAADSLTGIRVFYEEFDDGRYGYSTSGVSLGEIG